MIFKFLVAQYFVANANYVKIYVSYVSVTVCNLIEINFYVSWRVLVKSEDD